MKDYLNLILENKEAINLIKYPINEKYNWELLKKEILLNSEVLRWLDK